MEGAILERDGSEKNKKRREHLNRGLNLKKEENDKDIQRKGYYMCKGTELERVCHHKGKF